MEIRGRIGSIIIIIGYSIQPEAVDRKRFVTSLAVRQCSVVSDGDGLERRPHAHMMAYAVCS